MPILSQLTVSLRRRGGASDFLPIPHRRKDTSFLIRLSNREPVLPGTDQFGLEDA